MPVILGNEQAAVTIMSTSDTSPEVKRFGRPPHGWRRRLFGIVFESDTLAGRLFDLVLVAVILASVLVVMLDSVSSVGGRYGNRLDVIE